jgi:glutamate N-acetyltransferase / amino-acid N-acetyltransferase
VQISLGGVPVHIGGMCKGSGMIHPNMATMLGVVTCDADVEPQAWRAMLRRASDASFNAVSVPLHK